MCLECLCLFSCIKHLNVNLPTDIRQLLSRYRHRADVPLQYGKKREMRKVRQFICNTINITRVEMRCTRVEQVQKNRISIYIRIEPSIINTIKDIEKRLFDSIPYFRGKRLVTCIAGSDQLVLRNVCGSIRPGWYIAIPDGEVAVIRRPRVVQRYRRHFAENWYHFECTLLIKGFSQSSYTSGLKLILKCLE